MKLIFAGTPDFSVPTLKKLIESEHDVVAVLTQPDKPKGRGRKLTKSPIKVLAESHEIPVLQPITLKNEAIQSTLRAYHADIMIVIAYGLLLPKKVLEMFPLGCINVHASLLPKYRGASPIQAALLSGDKQTGVTIMKMDVGMDTGDMLHHLACDIDLQETAQTLHDKLAELGSQALSEFLNSMQQSELKPIKQDDLLATYAPKIKKTDAKIDWSKSAETLDREVRAYYGWPVSYTTTHGEVLRVWESNLSNQAHDATAGEVVACSENGIIVACGRGTLSLSKIQLPGGKILPVKDYLNANRQRFQIGTMLGT